ncbi:MAG: hypothetical protein ACWA42_07550 [Lutibacter sp.]
MKKFLLFVFAMSLGTFSLLANGSENPLPANKEIRSQIVDLLKTPQFDVENEITANITFTFSSEGELIILNVDSKHQDLLNYVRKHLNYKKLEAPGKHNQVYIMPFKIKTG